MYLIVIRHHMTDLSVLPELLLSLVLLDLILGQLLVCLLKVVIVTAVGVDALHVGQVQDVGRHATARSLPVC